MTAQEQDRAASHLLSELGFSVYRAGDGLQGSADVTPYMCVPGTTTLRTSILATWTDTLCGLLAVDVLQPRVPVTLELDVHLYRPESEWDTVTGTAQLMKSGRAVVVVNVEWTAANGRRVAFGTGSFMAAPNPAMTMPDSMPDLQVPPSTPETVLPRFGRRLQVPFAQRARCERREPGLAVLPRSDDGLNASNTVNGGLIALTVEEAVLSAAGEGVTLSSLALRYLRPVRIGPVVAKAHLHPGVARIEARDAGDGDRLAAYGIARVFGAGH